MDGGLMSSEREIRAAITMLGDAGNERIGTDIAEFGIEEAVARWKSGIGPKEIATRFPRALNGVGKQFDRLNSLGGRFVIPGDREWPQQLGDLDYGAPVGLWLRGAGDLSNLSNRMMAIVGARAATSYGERIASELAAQAAGSHITTISGAAYGIDAAAHRGSLAGGGATVAVLACGIDVAYPAAHSGLLERIAETGLVVSEAALGASPHKRHFLVRNRLIAALSSSTVVVEAALRSGSLSTGNWATSLGRDVWGVPGPMSSASSAGVHVGIQEGSFRIMTDYNDVLKCYPNEHFPSLGLVEDIVIVALREAPMNAERIALRAAGICSQTDIQAVLTLLEVTNRAVHDVNGWTLI